MELSFEESCNLCGLDDLRVKFDLLAALGCLLLREFKNKLFILFLRESLGGAILSLFLLFDVVGELFIIDVAHVQHCEECSQFRNDCLTDDLGIGSTEVGVLERAAEDHLVDLVAELELVALQLVTSQDLDDVVLADQLDDLLSHVLIALDVVRAMERASPVHITEHLDEITISFLHRSNIEAERRAVLPAFKLEEIEDVSNVILLVQQLAIRIGIYSQDLAYISHVFNKFLRESLLAERRERPCAAELVEVVEVHASVVEVNYWLHTGFLDLCQRWIGLLRVLHILLLEVF